ncbi:MAG: hypothetical protein ACLVEL_05120 [Ruthenibacterium sp.]|jgi:hypothetical protein
MLPASLSRGAEYPVSCITGPASCKRGSSRCVLYLFGIEYHLASLATDSEKPFTLHGKAGACVSPGGVCCRQASQEALKKSAACITCPAARKRAPFIQDYLSGNRKVVNLFSFRSMLEAKAFLLSPALLGDGVSLKLTKTRKKPLPAGRGFFL